MVGAGFSSPPGGNAGEGQTRCGVNRLAVLTSRPVLCVGVQGSSLGHSHIAASPEEGSVVLPTQVHSQETIPHSGKSPSALWLC